MRRLQSHGRASVPQEREPAGGRSMRALIVDDEPLARRGVVLRLRKFRDVEIVGECGDGSNAVKTILELSPDIVFLDVQMPGMDGFDVLRALPREPARRHFPHRI